MPFQAIQRYCSAGGSQQGASGELKRFTVLFPAVGIKYGARMAHAVPIVFVVDDDVSVRESLELLIRCEGWEPQTFASALEFLARPRALVPSCLVLDISLPGLNGLDLQKQVAVERPDVPIIFIRATVMCGRLSRR